MNRNDLATELLTCLELHTLLIISAQESGWTREINEARERLCRRTHQALTQLGCATAPERALTH